MAKIKKEKFKTFLNEKQSYIKQCYVSIRKLQLNGEINSNSRIKNISAEKNKHIELKTNFKECKVKLIRLKNIQFTSNKNYSIADNLGKKIINNEAKHLKKTKFQKIIDGSNNNSDSKEITNVEMTTTTVPKMKKNTIVKNFIEENDENQRNSSRGKRRNTTKAMIDNNQESQLKNKNSYELSSIHNFKLHSNDKGILRNIKQNQVDPINTESYMITRRRKSNNISSHGLEAKSKEINLIAQAKNKVNYRKRNARSKIKINKLDNILDGPTIEDAKKISSNINLNNKNIDINEKTNNYNSILNDSIKNKKPEVKKDKFFRDLRNNNLSHTNESEFRLGKNIPKKQKSQKNEKQKNKEFFPPSMENETSRKTKEYKRFDQIIESIENIDPIDKIITKKNHTKLATLSLKNTNPKRIIETENNKQDKLLNSKSDKSFLTITGNNNCNNESKNSIFDNEQTKGEHLPKSKHFFKSPSQRRPNVYSKENTSDIFDFQSSQSSSELNPNEDDVIAKLVKQGKAEVSKYKKGTGRLNLKRTRKKIPIKTLNKTEMINKNDATEKYQIDHTFGNIDGEGESSLSPKQKGIGFSPLARSAMKKYAYFNNTRQSVVDKKKLLEAAKKFLTRTSNINTKNVKAPIVTGDKLMTTRPLMKNLPFDASTPWRSPNLVRNLNYPKPQIPILNKKPSVLQFSDTSLPLNYSYDNSQSLNLSNIENLQPENKSYAIETNPRKGLTKRTPLKNINIIDVINLPPLAIDQINKYKTNTLDVESLIVDNFNFDDIITGTDNDNKLVIPKKKNLKDKLKKLKDFLPNKEPDLILKPTRVSNSMKSNFHTNFPVKQTNIREMFCSTMIDDVAQKQFNTTTQNKSNDIIEETFETTRKNDYNENDLHLFDNENSTFNINSSQRTYSRPRKRRKMRHQFVTCLSSESEDDECKENIHRKIIKKKDEENKKLKKDELTKFYKEFNSVCEDVDNFELMVVPESTT